VLALKKEEEESTHGATLERGPVMDTATTHHMACGADRGHVINVRAPRPGLPVAGATGVGIATEDQVGGLVINPGVTLSGALVQTKAKRSLMSVALMTQKGYSYVQTRTFAALIHDTEPPIMGVRESNGMFRVALGTPGNRAEMLEVKVALDKGRKAMEGLRMRAYLEHLKEGCRPKDAHLCDGCDRGQHKKKPAKRGGRSEAARMKNRKKGSNRGNTLSVDLMGPFPESIDDHSTKNGGNGIL